MRLKLFSCMYYSTKMHFIEDVFSGFGSVKSRFWGTHPYLPGSGLFRPSPKTRTRRKNLPFDERNRRELKLYIEFHAQHKHDAQNKQSHAELQCLSTEDFHKNHAGEQADKHIQKNIECHFCLTFHINNIAFTTNRNICWRRGRRCMWSFPAEPPPTDAPQPAEKRDNRPKENICCWLR